MMNMKSITSAFPKVLVIAKIRSVTPTFPKVLITVKNNSMVTAFPKVISMSASYAVSVSYGRERSSVNSQH
jgi:hypothetical protein